jgi:hypothetical protein
MPRMLLLVHPPPSIHYPLEEKALRPSNPPPPTDPEALVPCCTPTPTEESSLLAAPVGVRKRGKHGHIGKGLLYGAQVFYSFFIMLLFMTYNGWVMIAVALGAFVGYVIWGDAAGSSVKSVACH